MPLLIDGYNLLHATGITGRGRGPGGFERSRLALLNFLAESIDPAELPGTTVVFDASDAPAGLARVVNHRGITVRFASQHAEADDLIESLICDCTTPRRLLVVSSDHRIQRAARRRRSQTLDSDVWFVELLRARRERQAAPTGAPERPAVPLLQEDVEYWLRQFGGESALARLFTQEGHDAPTTRKKRKRTNKPPQDTAQRDKDEAHLLDNPFPPGYGEDLLGD
jgi:uncharacterized protein